MPYYDALWQLSHEHRLQHEATAAAERLALQARGRRPQARRLQRAAGLDQSRLHHPARQRTARFVVTGWPRG